MSVSQHPIALRLERQVGGATRLLATVMGLPLVDGIFPALVIAGALAGPWGILQTGLLIFGGSATVAVILAEMDGTRRQQAASVLLLGAVLIPVAVAEAALAATLESMLQFGVFHRFAGVVILTVAAKTASAEIGHYLPSPGVIVGLGLVASFQPEGAELALSLDPVMLAHAAAAAGTGVAFALAVALGAPHLRDAVDVDRFRFGSAVALGMLAIDVLGLLPTQQPVALGVLAVTSLFAYDPGSDPTPGEPAEPAVTDGGDRTGNGSAAAGDDLTAVVGDADAASADAASTDATSTDAAPTDADERTESDRRSRSVNRPERPPYL